MEHTNVPRENISKEKYPYRISRLLSARHIKLPRIQVGFPDGVYHARLVYGETRVRILLGTRSFSFFSDTHSRTYDQLRPPLLSD